MNPLQNSWILNISSFLASNAGFSMPKQLSKRQDYMSIAKLTTVYDGECHHTKLSASMTFSPMPSLQISVAKYN